MVNALEWLESQEEYNTKEKREQITKLDIDQKSLEGSLDLSDFINLTELWCQKNQLTELILPKNNNLQELICYSNLLTDLDFLSFLNKEKIISLGLQNNNFPEQDLSCFAELTKLKWLLLGTVGEERIKQGIYNRWTGSLEPLKNLSQLKELNISNTDLNSGYEYLPSSIKKISYSSKERPESKVKEIAEQLEWKIQGFTWQQAKEWIKISFQYQEALTWKIQGFTTEQTKEWLDAGFTSQDSHYCAWLKNNKQLTAEKVLNSGNEQQLREEYDKSAQFLLDKEYPDHNIKWLNIRDKNLKGELNLSQYQQLEELNCSYNKLASIILPTNPTSLKELNLSDNNFNQGLAFLVPATNLEELNIGNNPFYGNLGALKNLKKLKKLNISNTDIDSGLEYLPENLKEICCNSDYSHKSILIAKELEKYGKCLEEKKNLEGYDVSNFYSLDKWKANKANNAIISVIPLERLFVIRGNLQQFLKKWSNEDKDGNTELSKLQSPEQYSRFKYLEGVEWASTATTVAGGALTLVDYATTGGVITLIAPLIGAGASQLKSSFYENKKSKWGDFKTDADTFLDNYNELLGILKQIEVGEVGIVNESLKNLKRKVYYFLNSYDKDRNEEIEIKELTEQRKEFSEELSKVEEIIEAMKDLEEEVINCRQGQDSIVNELLKMSTNIEEELRKRVKVAFKKKFPKREIGRIIFLGRDEVESKSWFKTSEDEKDERIKLLIISNELEDNSNQKYYFNLVNSFFFIMASDRIEISYSSDSFDSEIKAIKKAIEIAEFKLLLTDEQKKRIENKVKQIYIEEKEINEEKDREREKIIRELKRKLSKKFQEEIKVKKEKKELQESDQNWQEIKGSHQKRSEEQIIERIRNWWTNFQNCKNSTTRVGTICWYLEQWKETNKESDNKGKAKEIILEQSEGETSLQAQIEQPPKN